MTATIDDALTYRGFPKAELIDDYRLALISRSLDDREISLQKQSRVFFQISGAGHEALLLAPGPLAARRLRLVLPVLPRPGARARRSASRRRRSSSRPSGRRTIPRVGRPPDAVPLGSSRDSTSSRQSSAHRQPVPARGRLRRGDALHPAAATCPGCNAHGDEITYVSLGEGATSRASSGRALNTACRLHLPVLYVVADNGYAISVPTDDQSPAADLRDGARLPRARTSPSSTAATTSQVRARRRASRSRGCAPVRARRSIHAKVDAAVLALGRRHAEQVPPARGARRRGGARPDPRCSSTRSSSGGVLTAGRRRPHPRARRRSRRRRGRGGAGGAAARSRRRSPTTSYVRPPDRPPPAADGRRRRAVVTFGEAIRRTLHEVMAADERIRVFGEDVADAPRGGARRRRGQGRRVRHDARAAARVRAWLAASTRRWRRRTSSAGRSARRCAGCGRAPRSSSSTTSGRP